MCCRQTGVGQQKTPTSTPHCCRRTSPSPYAHLICPDHPRASLASCPSSWATKPGRVSGPGTYGSHSSDPRGLPCRLAVPIRAGKQIGQVPWASSRSNQKLPTTGLKNLVGNGKYQWPALGGMPGFVYPHLLAVYSTPSAGHSKKKGLASPSRRPERTSLTE